MDRKAEYLMTFIVILSLNFALPRMMPGDPFLYISGDDHEASVEYSKEQITYYREYYGLDRPLHVQYVNYMMDVSRGQFGFSYSHREEVSHLIMKRLPWTFFLVGTSLALSILAGVLLGTYSAWKRNQWQDSLTYSLIIVLSEIPAFLIGLVLLVVFSVMLGWLPLSGAKTHFAMHTDHWSKVIDIIRHATLPIITLTIARTGGIYLMVRNSLSTVLTKDYMTTARAKGLKEYRIRYIHGLRNALLPLITRIALQVGGLVGGAVIVENLFSYPGLGTLMTTAVAYRDYPLLQGIFLVMGITVILANLIADLIYLKVDPRIEKGGRAK
ncbi:ABC transporter permease [Tindallia californiensis]|uniref:Peptide/nickel transport system permease protein n=1 Tax=Tindallia californiensis TaxID=159292 RepID=A0A1H3J2Z5_9FIRM|nr:ABC transporter permease [Tindallia californiensis]SDY34311.1 peptide/nickel transport system permease protein [Tindallia californiensis]